MKTNQIKLIAFQLICILSFNYAMWQDTFVPDQTSLSNYLILIIALFHALMFSLMIYTLNQKKINKHQSGLIMDLNMLIIGFSAFLGAANNCLISTNCLGLNYALLLMTLFGAVILLFETKESYTKFNSDVL